LINEHLGKGIEVRSQMNLMSNDLAASFLRIGPGAPVMSRTTGSRYVCVVASGGNRRVDNELDREYEWCKMELNRLTGVRDGRQMLRVSDIIRAARPTAVNIELCIKIMQSGYEKEDFSTRAESLIVNNPEAKREFGNIFRTANLNWIPNPSSNDRVPRRWRMALNRRIPGLNPASRTYMMKAPYDSDVLIQPCDGEDQLRHPVYDITFPRGKRGKDYRQVLALLNSEEFPRSVRENVEMIVAAANLVPVELGTPEDLGVEEILVNVPSVVVRAVQENVSLTYMSKQ